MKTIENIEIKSEILDGLLEAIPELSKYHAPESKTYKLLDNIALREAASLFSANEANAVTLQGIGTVRLPYYAMGNITTLDLWRLDELILFAWYARNKKRYKRVLDIGANVGLHSIILSKCGYQVTSFEPDPEHHRILKENLTLNDCANANVVQAAVSDKKGKAKFIRILNNTTSSHLAGAKPNAYGPSDTFDVEVVNINDYLDDIDFIKIDAEGQEAAIITAMDSPKMANIDIMVEVGTPENAKQIFEHFKNTSINIFSQRNGWQKTNKLEDMARSYRDGSVYITSRQEMTW
ncbi:MAG: hypothetical protein AUJ82_04770 [Verrucomicrobia bacterium CG1_02_43_26]|nr:MAG: hypothetical protein AUJ82_04770 [Verrucomicrobia bacterium CG1_02_43_26]